MEHSISHFLISDIPNHGLPIYPSHGNGLLWTSLDNGSGPSRQPNRDRYRFGSALKSFLTSPPLAVTLTKLTWLDSRHVTVQTRYGLPTYLRYILPDYGLIPTDDWVCMYCSFIPIEPQWTSQPALNRDKSLGFRYRHIFFFWYSSLDPSPIRIRILSSLSLDLNQKNYENKKETCPP